MFRRCGRRRSGGGGHEAVDFRSPDYGPALPMHARRCLPWGPTRLGDSASRKRQVIAARTPQSKAAIDVHHPSHSKDVWLAYDHCTPAPGRIDLRYGNRLSLIDRDIGILHLREIGQVPELPVKVGIIQSLILNDLEVIECHGFPSSHDHQTARFVDDVARRHTAGHANFTTAWYRKTIDRRNGYWCRCICTIISR